MGAQRSTSLSKKTGNKLYRQSLYVKQKREREKEKREARFRRKKEEDREPELRAQRVARNQPATIDRKRVWDDVDDDGLGASVDMEQLLKKRRLQQEEAEERLAAGFDEESDPEKDDDEDSMLGSDDEEESEADITTILPIREIINHAREKSPSPELSYEQKMERELEAMMQSEFGMKSSPTANESEAASRPRYQPLNKVNVRVTFQKKKN